MKKLRSFLVFCDASLAALMLLQAGKSVNGLLPENTKKQDRVGNEYNVLGVCEVSSGWHDVEFIGLDDPKDSDNEIDLWVPNEDSAVDIWKIKQLLESKRNITLTLRGQRRDFTAGDLHIR